MTNTEIAVALHRWSHAPTHGERAQHALRRVAWHFLTEETSVAQRAETHTLLDLRFVGPFTARVIQELLDGLRPAHPPIDGWSAEARADFEAKDEACQNYIALHDARRILTTHPYPRPYGDLQVHSTWSDGRDAPLALAEVGRAYGYQYIGITDHTWGLRIARGMTLRTIQAQRTDIATLNEQSEIRTLAGLETNVSREGDLDVDEQALRGAELVLAACHSGLRSAEDQTARVLRAVRHPAVHCLAHGRGRLFGRRPGLRVRWDEVFDAAAEVQTAIEMDAYPDRQDLDQALLARAAHAGCLISLGTDSHAAAEMRFMDIGLAHLVLAGVLPEQVLNYRPAGALQEWLARKRGSTPVFS
jgi:histidinol phosphatase-like PHP family hydrolase